MTTDTRAAGLVEAMAGVGEPGAGSGSADSAPPLALRPADMPAAREGCCHPEGQRSSRVPKDPPEPSTGGSFVASPDRAPQDDGAAGSASRAERDVQLLLGRLLAPLWVPFAVVLMRFGFGWRIREAARHRAEYARLLAQDRRPLLIAANHLTMVDSCVLAWGLGSSLGHVLRYRGLPWNAPLQARVESSWLWRALAYLMKCVPVPRGGDRDAVARVLDRLRLLMRRGEVVLLFPEAGRSRTGRVDTESVAQGVGRLVQELGDCRVLCVYLRGDAQQTYSTVPARGDTFTMATRVIEPRTLLRGVRASRDLSHQVLAQLVEMEQEYFATRGPAA